MCVNAFVTLWSVCVCVCAKHKNEKGQRKNAVWHRQINLIVFFPLEDTGFSNNKI